MAKRLQNRIAEGGLTLPVVIVTGIIVWLFIGLTTKSLWPQLACFIVSVYLLIELSNANVLLRVRSRMVSATFIMLSCTVPDLLGSLTGSIVQLCFICSLLMLFTTYQDNQAAGRTFYAFALLGIASMLWVYTLMFIPLLWVLMATQLQSLSWRTLAAALIGMVAPYWTALLYLIYVQDLSFIATHFQPLGQWTNDTSYASLTIGQTAAHVFLTVLTITGIIHFWRNSFKDKIRTRQIYGLLTAMALFTLLWIAIQPQHYTVLMRTAVVFSSPLIAHYLTLTHTRWTNISFIVIVVTAILLTAYNLLSPLLPWPTHFQ